MRGFNPGVTPEGQPVPETETAPPEVIVAMPISDLDGIVTKGIDGALGLIPPTAFGAHHVPVVNLFRAAALVGYSYGKPFALRLLAKIGK